MGCGSTTEGGRSTCTTGELGLVCVLADENAVGWSPAPAGLIERPDPMPRTEACDDSCPRAATYSALENKITHASGATIEPEMEKHCCKTSVLRWCAPCDYVESYVAVTLIQIPNLAGNLGYGWRDRSEANPARVNEFETTSHGI
jgi:hypothetical protein